MEVRGSHQLAKWCSRCTLRNKEALLKTQAPALQTFTVTSPCAERGLQKHHSISLQNFKMISQYSEQLRPSPLGHVFPSLEFNSFVCHCLQSCVLFFFLTRFITTLKMCSSLACARWPLIVLRFTETKVVF